MCINQKKTTVEETVEEFAKISLDRFIELKYKAEAYDRGKRFSNIKTIKKITEKLNSKLKNSGIKFSVNIEKGTEENLISMDQISIETIDKIKQGTGFGFIIQINIKKAPALEENNIVRDKSFSNDLKNDDRFEIGGSIIKDQSY